MEQLGKWGQEEGREQLLGHFVLGLRSLLFSLLKPMMTSESIPQDSPSWGPPLSDPAP